LFVLPVLWHCVKIVGSEELTTGRNIFAVMADPNATFRNVLRSNVRDSAHRILKRLRDQGRKRKRAKGWNQSLGGKKKNIKIHLFLNAFIRDVGMATEGMSVSSEFDIFAQKPLQASVQETIETIFSPMASVD